MEHPKATLEGHCRNRRPKRRRQNHRRHEHPARNLGLFEFVNADNIDAGLSPFNPEGAALAAGRVMLHRMRALANAGTSFAFETTGLRNLSRLYLPPENTAQIYDNTEGNTLRVASKTPGQGTHVDNAARWHRFQESQIAANDRR